MAKAIIDTFDLWTTAQTLKASNRGLSASNQSLLGIKKLRELIFELAISGKLVEQDLNDEPASKLIKRIEFEKKKLINQGKLKKQEIAVDLGEVEKPFDLPNGQGQRIKNLRPSKCTQVSNQLRGV
jgi:type I restriction enzyme S subunit